MSGRRVHRDAVWIPNRDGRRMYGILTAPEEPGGNGSAIVFCHAGVTSKAGTGEYMRILADELAAEGYTVLRFDQSGVGDSEGDLPHGVPIDAYYRKVQGGLAVEDTECAVAWLRREVRPRAVYLFGHCGGGITASLVAAREPGAYAGIISVALPVLTSQPNEAVRGRATPSIDGVCRRLLCDPRSVLRAVRERADIASVARALAASATRIFGRRGRTNSGARLHERFNRVLGDAFERLMERRVPVLILLAALDNETPEFDRDFKATVLNVRPEWAGRWRAVYLPDTDHSVMFEASRNRLTSAIVAGIPSMADRAAV